MGIIPWFGIMHMNNLGLLCGLESVDKTSG